MVREPGEGLLVVLSGPSGVGKGTVVRALRRSLPDLDLSTSVTTRRPRPGEADGIDYRFVDDDEFDRMVTAGELLEWATVHGHRSGTPRDWVEQRLATGRDVLLEIDVQGALAVRAGMPQALLIFIAPPSRAELVRRLAERGTENDAQRAVRRADADRELAAAAAFDHVIINDHLAACVRRAEEIIRQAKSAH